MGRSAVWGGRTLIWPPKRPPPGAFRIWEPEILAYFEARITNTYAEGITNNIKVIKRAGYGFRNFARFRERVLVQCAAA